MRQKAQIQQVCRRGSAIQTQRCASRRALIKRTRRDDVQTVRRFPDASVTGSRTAD